MCPYSKMHHTIRERKDFKRIQHCGQKRQCKHYIVVQQPNHLGVRRLGITASKKIGAAVKRNRVKRITREVFRVYYEHFPDSTDVVCIARKGSHALKMQEAAREILGCLMAV